MVFAKTLKKHFTNSVMQCRVVAKSSSTFLLSHIYIIQKGVFPLSKKGI